jgi:hypothetical protein
VQVGFWSVFAVTFVVVKRHKRLWIDRDGEAVYTPPNFIRLQSRGPIIALAAHLTEIGSRDINAIAEFETKHSSRR